MYNGLKRVHIVFSCGGALPVCGFSLAYPSIPPVSFSPGLSQLVHSLVSLLFLSLSSASFNYLSSSYQSGPGSGEAGGVGEQGLCTNLSSKAQSPSFLHSLRCSPSCVSKIPSSFMKEKQIGFVKCLDWLIFLNVIL